MFKDYPKDGDNADLKAFASKTLPTLQAHKEHVDGLDKKNEDKMEHSAK